MAANQTTLATNLIHTWINAHKNDRFPSKAQAEGLCKQTGLSVKELNSLVTALKAKAQQA